MSNTDSEDIEALLRNWYAGSKKVFKWCREFLPTEYIVLTKYLSDEFEVKPADNIVEFDHDSLSAELLIKLVKTGVLSFKVDHTPYLDVLRLKTGGCTCGSWAIASDYPHIHWCALYWRSQHGT